MNTRVEPLRVGLAILTILGLVVAMLMVFGGTPAFGHDGGPGDTCPEGGGWTKYDDQPRTVSGDWGEIEMSGTTEATEKLTATINEGYVVEICVKQASGHSHFSVTSENDGTIWDGDLSHWSYRVVQTPATTSTTTTVAGATTTTAAGVTTTTAAGATTTTAAGATTTPTVPETTTTVGITEETTTTTIEDEVLGTVITTSTIADEVLDTEVEAEELPFTGVDSDILIGLAVLLLISGLLVLGVTGSREDI